jgi:hypothetical protein
MRVRFPPSAPCALPAPSTPTIKLAGPDPAHKRWGRSPAHALVERVLRYRFRRAELALSLRVDSPTRFPTGKSPLRLHPSIHRLTRSRQA